MKAAKPLLLLVHAAVFALAAPRSGADEKPVVEAGQPQRLGPGDHERKLTIDGRARSYLVHVPPGYDPQRAMPVVLILHGAMTNGLITVAFTGMNAKADTAGFIAVYPNGTGKREPFLFWNAGGLPPGVAPRLPDDVAFIRAALDDLATVVHVDPLRIHATGISNGAMMCYKLAAELADRIASIAPVAGTMIFPDPKPARPVAVLHFHGTDDKLVPFAGQKMRGPRGAGMQSVEETVHAWCAIDGCPTEPIVTAEPDTAADGTTVTRKTYGPGKDGTEVVLYEITGGGHTWPGQKTPVGFLGRTTLDISANDLIWEFFQKHPFRSDGK